MTAPVYRAIAGIAADGTDPDALASVLGWVLRPRRTAAALRRRVADAGDGHDRLAAQLRAIAGDPPTGSHAAMTDLAQRWRRQGVRVALVGDPAYPQRLARGWPDVDSPVFLAWRGRLHPDRTSVAIVGARQASGYGTGVAAWLAAAAADADVVVVSGGALGIDAAAHQAALDGAVGTTVVLGCGHGVDYPRPHARRSGLFDRVLDAGGGLVSELLPWQPAVPAHVRARNRVVAGLSDAVVVVEGGARSGALVTANAAADRGIPVLAVPGDVRAPGSVAPHRLLSEGAAPCTGPADVFAAVHAVTPGDAPAADPRSAAPGGALPADVAAILVASWPRPVRIDDLALRTGRSVGVLLAATTRARVLGVLAEGPDGVRLRRAP